MLQATGQPMVLGLPAGFMTDLKWLLSTAYQQHGLLFSISLWSHDVLAVRRLNPEPHRARAILMMSNDRATDAYIGNALLPMIKGLQARMQPGGPRFIDAVLAFEVLNEPEGMSHFWRLYKVRFTLMLVVTLAPGMLGHAHILVRRALTTSLMIRSIAEISGAGWSEVPECCAGI